MVDGGQLGREIGRGFYAYPPDPPALPVPVSDAPPVARQVPVHGDGPIADALEAATARALEGQGWGPARETASGWTGVEVDGARLVFTDGRPAFEVAAVCGTADVAVFDRQIVLPIAPGTPLATALNAEAGAAWSPAVLAWLRAPGFAPQRVSDAPGLVVARTVAMLVYEANDAVLQGVCTEEDADAAMKLGVNYPAGPFEWQRGWSRDGVIGVLESWTGATAASALYMPFA